MFFKNLLRNWDWVDHPPTLLGTIPKFDRFFILKASLSCKLKNRFEHLNLCQNHQSVSLALGSHCLGKLFFMCWFFYGLLLLILPFFASKIILYFFLFRNTLQIFFSRKISVSLKKDMKIY